PGPPVAHLRGGLRRGPAGRLPGRSGARVHSAGAGGGLPHPGVHARPVGPRAGHPLSSHPRKQRTRLMSKTPYAVPYSSLPYQAAEVKQELLNAFEAVLDSGRYILGPEVAAFEREFASYCQAPHGVGIANGTCSLRLALEAFGVKPGDEVITVPN